ncbi:DgyrCDS8746 [Dimorphilus gyrociliatus]|uniref:DgyrCDS8746 n=1 Tax=Dimorphilus gyrociliatus TaxID=2664684 RepID=A0A7I8VV03_9ANNE|nr:DgyrCDS8746 [Dimorphilus gyrociliatus]
MSNHQYLEIEARKSSSFSPKKPRFWQIQLHDCDEKCTVTKAGLIGYPGRTFPTRRHKSHRSALKFIESCVSRQTSRGYVKKIRKAIKSHENNKKQTLKRGRPSKKITAPGINSRKAKTSDKNEAIKRSRSPKKVKVADTVAKATPSRKRKANRSLSNSRNKKVVRVTSQPTKPTKKNRKQTNAASPRSILKKKDTPPKLSKQDTLDIDSALEAKETMTKNKIVQRIATLTKTDSKPFIAKSPSIPQNMEAHTLLEIPLPGGQYSSGFGLHIDEDRILFGDEEGSIIELDHRGNVIKRSKLDQGVRCIVRDGGFVYAGGNDGGLYDLTNGPPRLMCKIEDFGKVYSLDVKHGIIAASDENGYVALVNYEGEIMWKKMESTDGWMVIMDDNFIYHGTIGAVSKMEKMTGDEIWKQEGLSPVNYGVKREDKVLVAAVNRVVQVDTETGKILNEYKDKGADTIYCCDKGDGLVFAGSDDCVLVYEEESEKLLYNLKVKHRPYSIKYYGGRLYLIGKAMFTILSLTKESIESMLEKRGKNKFSSKRIENILKNVPLVAPLTRVESINTVKAKGGIMLECVKDGEKLRVKPIGPSFEPDWYVMFPQSLRVEGAKYIVDKLEVAGESSRFYRTVGRIQMIED